MSCTQHLLVRKQCGKGDGEALEATRVSDKRSMTDLCPSRWRHRSSRETSVCHPALVAVVNKLRVLRNRGVVTIGRNRAFDSLSSDYYF